MFIPQDIHTLPCRLWLFVKRLAGPATPSGTPTPYNLQCNSTPLPSPPQSECIPAHSVRATLRHILG